MPRKPSPKDADTEQSKRFIDMAREIGVDERPDAFDKAFERVVTAKKPMASVKTKSPVR